MKKILFGLAATVISSTFSVALAAGAPAPSQPSYAASVPSTAVMNTTFFYVTPDIGYALYKWQNNNYLTDKSSGALNLGIDAGYQFMNYMALELGFHYLLSHKVNVSNQEGKLGSWNIDGGFKFTVPVITNKLRIFSKAGFAYTKQTGNAVKNILKPNASDAGLSYSDSGFVPMFAFGGDFKLKQNIDLSVEWLHIGGANNTEKATKGKSINAAVATKQLLASNSIMAGLMFHLSF